MWHSLSRSLSLVVNGEYPISSVTKRMWTVQMSKTKDLLARQLPPTSTRMMQRWSKYLSACLRVQVRQKVC